jgi:hypothetical protein
MGDVMNNGRVALVYPRDTRGEPPSPRLVPVVEALHDAGLDVESVAYADDRASEVTQALRGCDGALVWVNPLGDDGDRTTLDSVLRDGAARGLWVSAHPDVIDMIGTKQVLVATGALGWGSDAHLYEGMAQFRSEFPARLAADGVRVLKASRGNGGQTVWKVRVAPGAGGRSATRSEDLVLVQHAAIRDGTETLMSLRELMSDCERLYESWNGTGGLVDQEYLPSIAEGMIRCYLVGERIVGFARQYPDGTTARGPLDVEIDPGLTRETVFGLPSAKVMYDAQESAFADLRMLLETQWVPGMQQLLAVKTPDLPALWDVDLMLKRTSPGGTRRFVLCEINASCVTPFPGTAPAAIAQRVLERLLHRGRA